MPHVNLTIGTDGAAIDVSVAVGPVYREQLAIRRETPPLPVTIRAMIDTGADITAIHPMILEQFGGRPIGAARIHRAGPGNHYELASLCEVHFTIGGVGPGAVWIPVNAVGVAPSTPSVLALIGRDILAHCTLFYKGPRGDLTLSY